jgi:26S proteasome regulatory subunit N8
VHPLVLLSIVDHYNRVAKDTNKRVLGVLLGEVSRANIEITNSFAVPFEEEPRDAAVWFLDHNYLESMFLMFKKINSKETILGWYSTGPGIRAPDIDINEYFKKFAPEPLLVVIDVTENENIELPA